MTGRNKPTSTSRLKQDYLRLKRDPVPYITAEPVPHNILEWFVKIYIYMYIHFFFVKF